MKAAATKYSNVPTLPASNKNEFMVRPVIILLAANNRLTTCNFKMLKHVLSQRSHVQHVLQ